MTTLREAAQQALEALENDVMQRTYAGGVRISNAAIALRAALAAPVQEPVAWMTHGNDLLPLFHKTKAGALAWGAEPLPLYAAPPQRKPLTEEEIEDFYFNNFSIGELKAFARAIERAHGIGGQDES